MAQDAEIFIEKFIYFVFSDTSPNTSLIFIIT